MRVTRVVAAVLAVFWGVLFFGVQDLLTVFDEGPSFHDHYVVESGWGLFFLVLVAVPLIGIAVRPDAPLLRAQVALAGAAEAAAAFLALQPGHVVVASALLLSAAAVGWRVRRPIRLARRPGRVLLVLTAVAAAPCLWYAVDVAGDPRAQERTWWWTHGPLQGALALAVVLVALLVAVYDARGRTLSAVTVAVPPLWIGIESIAYPDLVGSVGTVGGVLTALWGVGFLGAFLRARGQARATRSA